MAYNQLVGLNVTDEAAYGRYREAMTPLLKEHGGRFRHDFRIAETIRSEAAHPINRLFVLSFPSREASDRFFDDERYVVVRARHFAPSVHGVSVLTSFEE